MNQKPAVPFLHPRPPRDPRIVLTNLTMIYVAVAQIRLGPPPTSVNARAFTPQYNVAYLIVLAVASLLVLAAAFVGSEYLAVSLELIGCIGAGVIYFLFLRASATTGGATTQSVAWAFAFCAGSGLRALMLVNQVAGNPARKALRALWRRR